MARGDYSRFIKYQECGALLAKPEMVLFTLTMNRVEYTKRMLRSLELCLTVPYTHVIVDQGSIDETVSVLENHMKYEDNGVSNTHLVVLDRNIGISAGSNLALDIIEDFYPDASYIWKVDNDCCLLRVGMDRIMMDVCAHLENKVVLSPFVEGLRENKGGVPRYASCVLAIPKRGGIKLGFAYHLGGICEFAHRDSYKGFLFDEEDTLSGSQDSSYSAYVGSLEYKMAYVEDIACVHIDGTQGQHDKFPEYFKKRAEYDSKTRFKDVGIS
jgi:glycosyltransferase involved in cell wall biosynthesis